MFRNAVGGLFLLVASVAGASAQTSTPPPVQGPLVLEPIHSPFILGADYKITEIDGDVGHMAGVRAGRLVDDVLFAGGAVYWLPDGKDGTRLTYGGALFGWSSSPSHRLRFGGGSLVGVGSARLASDFTILPRDLGPRHDGRSILVTRPDGTHVVRALVRDDFFVFEPQASLNTRVTNHVSVDWAAGYRFVGFTDALRDRLDGVAGSLEIRFTF